MNYGTFHINAIFDGFGMGRTRFFLKSRVIGVTRAKFNIGHSSFLIYKQVLDPNRPNTSHLNGFKQICKDPIRMQTKKKTQKYSDWWSFNSKY